LALVSRLRGNEYAPFVKCFGDKLRGALLATLTVACAACALFPGAASAGTLDQQQTGTDPHAFSIGTNQTVAQTFTAGLSGNIDRVDLVIDKEGAPAAPLGIEIRSVSGGSPTSTVLAAISIPASRVPTSPTWGAISFASPATAVAGTQYAIVASSAATVSNEYEWTEAPLPPANPYAGGAVFSMAPAASGSWASAAAGVDLAFKTYVAPPPTGERAAAFKKCKKKHSKTKRRKCRKRANRLPV
jgi:hypothetical protein